MRNHSLVILALPRWDGPYSSTSFSLAKEFSHNHKVYYIDNPLTYKDIFSFYKKKHIRKRIAYKLSFRKTEKKSENLTILYPPFVFPINFLQKGKIYDFFFKINSRLVFVAVKKILIKLHVDNYLYINSFNPFYHYTHELNPALFIYHTVDDIRLSPYINKHGSRLEPQLVHKADLTFTTSLKLRQLNLSYSNNVYYLPNAADFNLFNKKPNNQPIEFKNIKQEIIIYTGHLDWRTDLDLLMNVARYNKERILVIIGPISLNEKKIEELKSINNILFIPPKPISKLSNYLYYSQCAIIPFLRNELTESIYPLKVNEYLATGIPIVSTPFSDDVKTFDGVISLASNAKEFNASIESEIQFNTQSKEKKRRASAQKNTWNARVKGFWKIVDTYL